MLMRGYGSMIKNSWKDSLWSGKMASGFFGSGMPEVDMTETSTGWLR
jgi:hypothetical protein